MNIFKILSSYDGTIKEPNISALLAYLLDANEDHGLGDALLKSIIKDFQKTNAEAFKNLNDLNYEIKAEFPVEVKNSDKKRRDIDLLIEFYVDKKLVYALCIENKITDSSIQDDNQLQDELNGLKNYYAENELKPEIYFVFLTLKDSKKSNDEFSKLDYDKKLHLHWKGENSILAKLLELLDKERRGEIDPIAGDLQFIIKSFIAFIRADFTSDFEEKQEKREKQNYGDPLYKYFTEVRNDLDKTKVYKVEEVKKLVSEKVGKAINPSTLNAQMKVMIVNEPNRKHHSVTTKNQKKKNLFYYPSEDNKTEIMVYSEQKGVNVYLKDKE